MILDDTSPSVTMPPPDPSYVEEEERRLDILESFEPDALEDDPELHAIVQFAARLCGTPASQVTLVEDVRQHFLAREGITERATPREGSFCAHTMLQSDIMEIRDTTQDKRFVENMFVAGPPNVRFYAGQPLVSDEGAPLGAICVFDLAPRPDGLTDLQREGLAVLGQAVMRRLNARRAGLIARRTIADREEQLRRIIEGVPQIAWSADAHGNFDYFNARWEEFTGHPSPKVADDWLPFIHPEDASDAVARWEACLGSGEDYEAEMRMRHADGSWRWVLSLGVPVAGEPGDPVRWFGTITDIHELHQALEARDVLAKELSHRIKNLFAVVMGLTTLKARQMPEHKPFASELNQILHALSRAHDSVRPTGGKMAENLHGLLAALFAPYRDAAGRPRVRITGADAGISPRGATPISLVFHELATNSAKYGALSNDAGYVELSIEARGENLALTWSEHDGPPVRDPGGKEGFGSRLVETSVTGQLRGTWDRRFEEDGLIAALTVSRQAIAA